MVGPNQNTYKVALNNLRDRCWKTAHEKGRERGYTEYDISLAFQVELRKQGLHITWKRGKRPHVLDVRAVINGADND